MGSWAFLEASWEFDSLSPPLGLAGLSPGAAEATQQGKGQGRLRLNGHSAEVIGIPRRIGTSHHRLS